MVQIGLKTYTIQAQGFWVLRASRYMPCNVLIINRFSVILLTVLTRCHGVELITDPG